MLKYLNPRSRTYLIEAIVVSGLKPEDQNKSYISIFELSSDSNLKEVFVVNATSLYYDTVRVTDITTDTLGYIYFGETNIGVLRFQFDLN